MKTPKNYVSDGGTTTMKKALLIFLCMGALILLTVGIAQAKIVPASRVTIDCQGHNVTVTSLSFVRADLTTIDDPNPALACGGGGGGGATKIYPFSPPEDIVAFDFYYTCDNGPLTHVTVPSSQFYFHIPLGLVCPSPGGSIELSIIQPGPGVPMIIISDHDALTWPGAECFKFRTANDYVAVTWYCETADEPVWRITPGCSSPECANGCDDPNCVPAIYQSIMYSAKWSPVPNIWVRVFWPIGLVNCCGCWCYHFDYQLAVNLASFAAEPADRAVQLRFATASENDNGHFEIWRGTSPDGNFEMVTSLASQGNSATSQSYSYRDREVTPGVTYWYYLVDEDAVGHRVEHRDRMVSAAPTGATLPTSYSLSAYPNPFNPSTSLEFALPEAGRVDLVVYDVAGREVAELTNSNYAAGTHRVTFDASHLPSGIYMARLTAGNFVTTHKLLLIK
jgi:hypothetical protein